jgi:hypothetical protein
MIYPGRRTTRCTIILTLLSISTLLAACQTTNDAADAEVAPCQSEANVDSVQVEERSDEYYAIVKGHLPDACTKTDAITQTREGDTIYVTVCTTRPEGMVCAQMLAPYEEEILLNTAGLSSGEYTVDVNGVTSTLTIP